MKKAPATDKGLNPCAALFRMGAFVDALSVSLYRF